MAVQRKSSDVIFDTSATTATNVVPVGTAVPGELPGELVLSTLFPGVKLAHGLLTRTSGVRDYPYVIPFTTPPRAL